MRLFNMINDLPTIFEVVTGMAKKQAKEKSSVSNHSSNKSKSNSMQIRCLVESIWASDAGAEVGILTSGERAKGVWMIADNIVFRSKVFKRNATAGGGMRMVWKWKMKRSMERHFLGHVERAMRQMSSGFTVISVRSGSMENV
ncbi:putative PHD finger protein ALFIN-LIKE 4 [Sesbania bispinosa]|nr:putative PHD finger protein ALFIN-LIKE 4 [Sesbania bispinosa]